MTREDIIRMGAESKISLYSLGKEKEKFINYLESFAALVASAEREACAKVVETLWDIPTNGMATEEQFYGNECAKVIRARGQA